jgi:hypothetical protein
MISRGVQNARMPAASFPPPCHIPARRPSPARFVRQAEGLVGLVGLVGLLFRRRPTAGMVMCVGAGMVTSPAPFRIRPIDFSSSSSSLVQISGHHWTTRPRDLWGPAMPRMRMRVEEGIPFRHVLRDPLRPVSHVHWTLSPADDPRTLAKPPTSVLRAHERKWSLLFSYLG